MDYGRETLTLRSTVWCNDEYIGHIRRSGGPLTRMTNEAITQNIRTTI